MADRVHQTFRATFKGLNTRLLADAMLAGKWPAAINIVANGDSKIRTRSGYSQAFITGASRITDIGSYATLNTDSKPRIIVHDSAGGVWLDDGIQKGTVGFGGTGASLIPYRPAQSPQAWMYVGNATGYMKFSAPDASNNVTAQKTGIAEPQSPPDAVADGFQFTDFTGIANNYSPGGSAAAVWANAGVAQTPTYTTNQRSANGSGDTVVAIFADPAAIGPVRKVRYSVQLASVQTYAVGETLIFTIAGPTYQNAEVEDVIPAIKATSATVTSILYLNGNTGKCIVVPSIFQYGGNTVSPLSTVRRGSLIQIGSEVCLVLGVTVADNGALAIDTSTTVGHAAGETFTGINAIVTSGITSAVVGSTVGSAYIACNFNASGTGTLTQTLGTNPFNADLGGNGIPQPNDYIHISLSADDPTKITTCLIQIDVGNGNFDQTVLEFNIAPGVINKAPVADLPQVFFSEIKFNLSQLVQILNTSVPISLTATVKVRISLTVTASMNLYFGSLWVGGGDQLDVGAVGAAYQYRVRPRSALTGATGNPSPVFRYGLLNSRQRSIIVLPSAAYDSQIDTWDIERYGGTVPSWHRVGSTASTAATFVDDASDAAATVGEPLDFDNFEPWPTVDVPLTLTIGVAGVTAINVVGTAIQVFGPSTAFLQSGPRWLGGTLITLDGQSTYTLWNRPTPIAGGLQFRTVENMGAPTPGTVFIEEPIVANQPNPFLVGPDSFGVIYAMGDPLRPGFVSVSKQYAPDMTGNNVLDLTPPSESMMGGQVIDGITALASSERWWQIQQPGFTTATQWLKVEIPAGRGLAAPFGHCTDGKLIYFVAKDGIYAMIMGFPAQSLTDADIGNLFPHDGIPGQNTVYNGQTFYAPSYAYVAQFRLSIINNMLRFHHYDSNGVSRCLRLDLSLMSDGNQRLAWSQDQYHDPMTSSYEPEQPPGALQSIGTSYSQGYLADSTGKVYTETDLANDNGTPISCVLSTPEWDGGDARLRKMFLDALIDCVPQSQITVQPVSGGSLVGGTPLIGANTARQLAINPLASPPATQFPVQNFMGLFLSWTDDFSLITSPTTINEWSVEAVPQPILVRSWQSVPTSHGLQGYHFIYRIRFAYVSFGTVTLTITAFDGTSPAVITLPNTSGAYQKVEFVPTFNKGLLFTYQGVSTQVWAPILDSCEILVGQWGRSTPCSIFLGLGGVEAA